MKHRPITQRRIDIGKPVFRSSVAPARKRGRALPTRPPADQPRREKDQRERGSEKVDRDERHRSQSARRIRSQSSPTHANDRLQNDREHRGFQAEEQRRHRPHGAEQDVNPRKRKDRERARQNEQRARDQPPAHAVEQPADVCRQLLRLGPGQQHAKVERVEKPRFADPSLLVDQDAMHQRDLPCRPAETERRDPRPDLGRLTQCNAVCHRHTPLPRKPHG